MGRRPELKPEEFSFGHNPFTRYRGVKTYSHQTKCLTCSEHHSAISSASPPSCRTPKQRRHGGQRDEHVSSQTGRIRPSNGPFLPHSPPPSLILDFGHGRTSTCPYALALQYRTLTLRSTPPPPTVPARPVPQSNRPVHMGVHATTGSYAIGGS